MIEHIEQLLLRNDCVIVPGLGGFVANRTAAEVTGAFVVPSRRIMLFNVLLTYNDGLLAQEYMRCDRLTFQQAMDEIGRAVAHFKKELSEWGNVSFGRLGVFSTAVDGSLTFRYSGNVELDIFNYGLKKLNFAPLASERKSSFGMKEWVAAAAVLLLLLLPLNLLKHQEPYSSASLSSLVTAVERMAQDPLETVTQETVLDSLTVASEMPDSLNLAQSEIALAEAEAPAPESVEQQSVAPQTVYHVIIASLSSQAKARQYMSEISEYNFDNLEIVRAENRYRVSVANFTSEDSAESFLADFKLRHEAFASAWVFAEKAD
ncbi:MAG: SPOR domain-containing protein [Paludibacteraceae bacterium]|nr:SPOR domain-containing protein [Paludibacteraceae bacterium]